MTKETRREKRRRERDERNAKREKRKKDRLRLGKPCDPLNPEAGSDPLRMYSRHSVFLQTHPLRDYWRFNPAFLICGGPSINDLDLTLLEHPAVCSIAVNNVAGHVRPKAFIYSDPTEKFHGGIFLNPGIMKFAPVPKLKNQIRLKNEKGEFEFSPLRVRDCPSVWGFERCSDFSPETFLTQPQAAWGCSRTCPDETKFEKVLFTPFLALRILHYLGVRKVFLLGMDFNMEPGERGYAFAQGRTKGAARSNNDHYRKVHFMLDCLKPVFDEAGFRVYNCNDKSHLSTFPHLSYESAIEYCHSLRPSEPYDLSKWYEKDPTKPAEEDKD